MAALSLIFEFTANYSCTRLPPEGLCGARSRLSGVESENAKTKIPPFTAEWREHMCVKSVLILFALINHSPINKKVYVLTDLGVYSVVGAGRVCHKNGNHAFHS